MTRRAFTLMELLVGVAIFMVVIGLSSSMFMKSLRYYGDSQQISSNMIQVKTFLNRIGDEMSSTLPVIAAKKVVPFRGTSDRVDFLYITNDGVRERSYLLDVSKKELRQRYSVRDGDYETYDKDELALKNVVSFELEYLKDSEWVKEMEGSIPKAVKVKITISSGTFNESLEEIIYIPVSS